MARNGGGRSFLAAVVIGAIIGVICIFRGVRLPDWFIELIGRTLG